MSEDNSVCFELSQKTHREFLDLQMKVDLEVEEREKKRKREEESILNSVTPTKSQKDVEEGDEEDETDEENETLLDESGLAEESGQVKVANDLFCWKCTTLHLVETSDHKVDYIKVYTKHLYDRDYMSIIHNNYSKFLNDWEDKVRWTIGELLQNNYWKQECLDTVTTFFEVDGLFQQAKKELDEYDGLVVIHALCDKAFYNALKIRHAHIGSLFRWAGLCTSCRVYIDPDVECATFEIVTQFEGVNGERFVWKFE